MVEKEIDEEYVIPCSVSKIDERKSNVLKTSCKGPYIRYPGGGEEGFVGVMKYFRHILMDHEIFFKYFGGTQSIFLWLFW